MTRRIREKAYTIFMFSLLSTFYHCTVVCIINHLLVALSFILLSWLWSDLVYTWCRLMRGMGTRPREILRHSW